MNEQDQYMADFMKVFETLEYWGPGSEEDTLKALSMVPIAPKKIADIGCGKGLATLVLATHSHADLTAVDSEQSALDSLKQRGIELGLSQRLSVLNASMSELPFSEAYFDLLWAEGSAYIMGTENALEQWKLYLTTPGYLVLSDMVWRTETPSDEALAFWHQEYPDIQLVDTRLKQMECAGYRVLSHFPQCEQSWSNYYGPLADRVNALQDDMASSQALKDIAREVEIAKRYANEFGYHMFVLEKL